MRDERRESGCETVWRKRRSTALACQTAATSTWHYCCWCKSQPVTKFLVKSWKTILQTHKNTWGGWTGHSKRDSLRNETYGARPVDENVRKRNPRGDYYRHGEWKWSRLILCFSQWCWVHWWRCMFFLPEEVQQDPPEAPDSPVITFTLPRLHGSNLGLLMSCSWGQFIRNIPGPDSVIRGRHVYGGLKWARGRVRDIKGKWWWWWGGSG